MTQARLDQLRIKQLRFLELLSTLGSLAATAESLAMTPSAASMMLKEIEGLFGLKLFQRQGRGMALTSEGSAMLARCKTVLGEVGAMSQALGNGAHAVLRIGAFPHTTTTVLPQIVKRMLKQEPNCHIRIVDGSAAHLLALLRGGEIDLLLGRLPSAVADGVSGAEAGNELAQRVLYEGKLSVVAAQNHPLALKKTVPFAELQNWQWILPGLESTTRSALADEFSRRGLAPPTPVVESPSFFYSLSIVAHTELLTCCAHSAALRSGHGTSILPLSLGTVPTPVTMVWRKSSLHAQWAVSALAM